MTAWNNTKNWFVKYACFFFKLIIVILLVIVLGIIYKIASGISKAEDLGGGHTSSLSYT